MYDDETWEFPLYIVVYYRKREENADIFIYLHRIFKGLMRKIAFFLFFIVLGTAAWGQNEDIVNVSSSTGDPDPAVSVDKHWVYGSYNPFVSDPYNYYYIDSSVLPRPTALQPDPDFNVYVVDVGNVSTGLSITATGNSYIEFRGSYVSSGALTFNPGTLGVRLNDTEINLGSNPFSTGSSALTLNGQDNQITASNITLGNVAGNNHDLTLETSGGLTIINSSDNIGALFITGNAQFGGAVFPPVLQVNAHNITVTGNCVLRANVTTSGAGNFQNYGSVRPFSTANAAIRTLTGSLVTIGTVTSEIVGGIGLALEIAGDAVFTGSVSEIRRLTVSGSAVINGNITTNGNTAANGGQVYNGPVNLGGNITFTGGGAATVIHFANTINSNSAVGRGLIITNAIARFDNAAGGSPSYPITSVTANGAAQINGNITTSGNQTYAGTVTLGGNITLTGGGVLATTVRFENTVSGTGAARNLVIANASAEFVNTVGGNIAAVNVAGTSTINANITTTAAGGQTYTGPVVLTNNITFAGSAASSVTFGNTVTGNTPAGTNAPSAWRITISGANVRFNGQVGANDSIMSVDVNAGTAYINADITTSGVSAAGGDTGQDYRGNVELGNSVTLDTNGYRAAFRGNVYGAHGLEINADAWFRSGSVNGTNRLTSLTVNGDTFISTAMFDINTNGPQTYNGVVNLGATGNLTLNASSAAGNTANKITFGDFIAAQSGVNCALIINNANVEFTRDVGAGIALNSVVVNNNGAAIINGNITTSGVQTFTGVVTLAGTIGERILTGSTVTLGATSSAGAPPGDNRSLRIAGNAQFNSGAAVMAVQNVAVLTVTGTATITNGNITTTGNQSYAAINLGTALRTLTSTGGEIRASGIVNGNNGLNVYASKGIVMEAANTLSGVVRLNNNQGTAENNVSLVNSSSAITINSLNESVNGTITVMQTGTLAAGTVQSAQVISLSGSAGVNINGAVIETGANINLTSGSGAVSGTGQLKGAEMTVTAITGITLNNTSGSVPVVSFNNTSSGSISYNSSLGASNTLTVNANNGAATGGNITITEATGDLIIGTFGSQAVSTSVNQGEVTLTATAGFVTVNGNIGSASARNGAVVLTSGNDKNVAINNTSTINCFSLALISGLAENSAGEVNIEGDITVTSGNASDHDKKAAVYIYTAVLEGNGNIHLASTGWICADILLAYTYTGNITGGQGIHFHSRNNRNIIYRHGPDDLSHGLPAGSYLYLRSDSNLGNNFSIFAKGTGNIYIIDVDNGSLPAYVRDRNTAFSTETNGFIEIRGAYTSSGIFALNSGIGNIRFVNAVINLTGAGNPFNSGSSRLTLIGTLNAITAANITVGGGIYGTSDLADNITLSVHAASGVIGVTGTIGQSALKLGDIEIVRGAVTLSGTSAVFARNYTQDDGSAVFGAGQNYTDSFLFNSVNSITLAGDITANNNILISGESQLTAAIVNITGSNINAANIFSSGSLNMTGDVITLQQITAQNITVDNNALYTQNGAVNAGGIFRQISRSGTGSVSLGANITATNTSRANAVISFANQITLAANVAFTVPSSTGGFIELTYGVINNNFLITFAGGSSNRTLELKQTYGTLGDIMLAQGSYVLVNDGTAVMQTDGKTLTLAQDAVLDISAFGASWHIGISNNTTGDFAGIDGVLSLGANSLLVTKELNLIGGGFSVNNSGWAAIRVTGNVLINDDTSVTFTAAQLPYLVLEMAGNAQNPQNLTAKQPLGSLHVGVNSRTVLNTIAQEDAVYFRGEVIIRAVSYPAGLEAGNLDIVMYSGLSGSRNVSSYLHNGTDTIHYTRWEITDASYTRPPFASRPDINNFVFRQAAGRKVSFKRDAGDSSSAPVFFEIAGNTMWQDFECFENGAFIQFSRHPDHHTVIGNFSIKGGECTSPDTHRDGHCDIFSDHKNYVTITRLTEENNFDSYPYIFDPLVMEPPLVLGEIGTWALPAYFPPVDLKSASEAEKQKYWNLNLVSTPGKKPLENFNNVRAYFSHAYNERIPIEAAAMRLDVIPFYKSNPRVGYFNFDWIELRKILYSFTEDSNGNGRLDRIRVQTNLSLNGNFSGFEVKVEGYQIDVSKFQNGYQMVNEATGTGLFDNDSFYIYLLEKPDIDSGVTPVWHVTRNNSLEDALTGTLIGDPEIDKNIKPFDTIPPRFAYTLTLPGHPQTYVRMSESVISSNGNANPFDNTPGINKTEQIESSFPYRFIWQYFQFDNDISIDFEKEIPGADLAYLLQWNDSYKISDLAQLKNLLGDTPLSLDTGYFRMDNMVDQAQRAMDWSDHNLDSAFYIYYQPPKYPLNWGYTEYAKVIGNRHLMELGYALGDDEPLAVTSGGTVPITDVFLPPNRLLTADMMTAIANGNGDQVTPDVNAPNSVIRRVTDTLVSRSPGNIDYENYFAWPVWARYKEPLNADMFNNNDIFWGQQPTDTGIIWEFDGTKYLESFYLEERGNIEMQARLNSSLANLNLNLELLWTINVPENYRYPKELPRRGINSGGLWLPGNNLLYYFAPVYDKNEINSISDSSSNFPLYTYMFNRIGNNEKVEFIFRISNSDMFIARLNAPQNTVPENWYTLVRPFSFDIQDIRRQRGGVTVLNNVINSDNMEEAYIRYHLARPGRVTIQVYTLDGTLVRSLRRNEYRAEGEYTDAWNGTNNGGRPVARGMYFVRVVGPDIDEIRKIMVVR